jgi:hypothetical protein
MNPRKPATRRDVLKAAAGIAAVPAAAATLHGRTAWAQDMPRQTEDDPAARALGYVHNASNVDANRYPRYESGQLCSNCNLIQGSDGDAWRPCDIFPGRLVAANGWCSAWVPRG